MPLSVRTEGFGIHFLTGGFAMFFRRVRISSLVLICLVFASGIARGETFFAYLSSAQEVPTNASTATGFARVFVNEAAGTLSFTVTFTGLSSNQTAAHIHAPAAIGVNVGVAINFGVVGGTSGTITGTAAITPTQLSQIRQHLGYVNVHSANFPGGEIRGQLGIKRPVDFDGDGRQDFSVLKFPATAPQSISYWNLNSTVGAQVVGPFGDAATDFPGPGDYDGDGRDDLALYRVGATAGAQSFFYTIRSSDSTFTSQQFGLSGDTYCGRDYDGDGITDVAVFRRGVNLGDPAFFFYRGSQGNPTGAVTYVRWGTTGDTAGGTSGDVPVPGDYDGDGKFDVAVYRFGALSPTNTFLVRRSSDGVVVYQPWGNFNTDYVVPGDYDGDGKYDFAVARTGATAASPMNWWILQSSNGSLRVQPFGISSDLPAQGDYDGDARADIAIYRRGATAGAQSNFWVFESLAQVGRPTQWGVGADFATATFDAR